MPKFSIYAEGLNKATASQATRAIKKIAGIDKAKSTKDSIFVGHYRFSFEAPTRREANKARDAVWELNCGCMATVEKVE